MKVYTIECRKATESVFKDVKARNICEAKRTASSLFGKAHGLHIFLNSLHVAFRFAGSRKWYGDGVNEI